MSDHKGVPVRAAREHLGSYYGYICGESIITTRHGTDYTFEQVRSLVLDAVRWLNTRGWSHPDVNDLLTYGPKLHDLKRADLQEVIDDLVCTEDLVLTLLTPPHCNRPRPCYALEAAQ